MQKEKIGARRVRIKKGKREKERRKEREERKKEGQEDGNSDPLFPHPGLGPLFYCVMLSIYRLSVAHPFDSHGHPPLSLSPRHFSLYLFIKEGGVCA